MRSTESPHPRPDSRVRQEYINRYLKDMKGIDKKAQNNEEYKVLKMLSHHGSAAWRVRYNEYIDPARIEKDKEMIQKLGKTGFLNLMQEARQILGIKEPTKDQVKNVPQTKTWGGFAKIIDWQMQYKEDGKELDELGKKGVRDHFKKTLLHLQHAIEFDFEFPYPENSSIPLREQSFTETITFKNGRRIEAKENVEIINAVVGILGTALSRDNKQLNKNEVMAFIEVYMPNLAYNLSTEDMRDFIAYYNKKTSAYLMQATDAPMITKSSLVANSIAIELENICNDRNNTSNIQRGPAGFNTIRIGDKTRTGYSQYVLPNSNILRFVHKRPSLKNKKMHDYTEVYLQREGQNEIPLLQLEKNGMISYYARVMPYGDSPKS